MSAQEQYAERNIVIIGGGPLAMSTSAMLSMQGVEHAIVYPEQDNDEHRYSSQAGQYRQFSMLNGLPKQQLEHLAKFYKEYDIETMPVESVLVFDTEDSFKQYHQKFSRDRRHIQIVELSELPVDNNAVDVEGYEPFYPKAIVQKTGAFNINMGSFMQKVTALSKTNATHITGRKATSITKRGAMLDSGQYIGGTAVIVAAGPYSGDLISTHKNLVAKALRHCYDIHGAPTLTFELEKDSDLHDRPMNFSFIQDGKARAFGIYENSQFRISLYDLERDQDLEFELSKASDNDPEARQKLDKYKKNKDLIRSYVKAKKRNPDSEEYEGKIKELQEKNELLLGDKTTFKSMDELPKEVANQEKQAIKKYTTFLNINSHAIKETVAPYTTTHLGAPIIGKIPNTQNTESEGLGCFVAFGGNGGSYKNAFGPDIFTSLSGIAFQKTMLELYGTEYPRQLQNFNYRQSSNLFEVAAPTNHVAAAEERLGKPLVIQDFSSPVYLDTAQKRR